mgnify:CR=1 FL=1
MRSPLRFLFTTAERHSNDRADVRVLFGKYLLEFGAETDLFAAISAAADMPPWGGGRTLIRRADTRFGLLLADIGQQLSLFWRCFQGHDGLMGRDKPFLSVIGLTAGRLAHITFIYWMSFSRLTWRSRATQPCGGRAASARGFAAGLDSGYSIDWSDRAPITSSCNQP